MFISAQLIFWIMITVLVYTYVGYPLLIRLWASRPASPSHQQYQEPAVSILIVAYNEAQNIAAKIDNLFTLDYPAEWMEVVIACDGCTDDTAARARLSGNGRVRVVERSPQRGKASVLSEQVPRLRGDIVVLMDARQKIAPGALRALVAGFADPRVGAVGGELVLTAGTGDSATGKGVGFYWRYEKFIRRHESRVDSSVGVSGSIYAIRQGLFTSIPDDTLLDDVLIPMQVVRQGYRVLFEPRARAYDKVVESSRQEFRRKVRTIAGNFQLLVRHPWLLNPFRNRLWIQTLSHKLFRLIGPLCLITVFICNLLLAGQPLYSVFLGLQVLFYSAALAGSLSTKQPSGIVSVPYAFCLLNWATVLGFFRFLFGRQRVTWKN